MRPLRACGSEFGHRLHRRLGERPCRGCCDAAAVAKANRRARAHTGHQLAYWRSRPQHLDADDPDAYLAARNGTEPAEALTQRDRHRLVAELHRLGWTDAQIATHTRMTTYTTGRIREHLGLPALDRPAHGPNRRTA